jgi:hypothetical protein
MLKIFSASVALSLALSAFGTAAQTIYTGPGTYQRHGQFTYGPNGSTQQQIGQFTYVNPGNGVPARTYQQIGPFTYGSNGSSSQRIGQFQYGSDGTTIQQIGQFTYIHRPDGSTVTCQQIGAQTYCN